MDGLIVGIYSMFFCNLSKETTSNYISQPLRVILFSTLFYDFFHDLFKFSLNLGLTTLNFYHIQEFQNFICLRAFFLPYPIQQTQNF